MSTKTRITECEDTLASHTLLIQGQISKFSVQEELTAKTSNEIKAAQLEIRRHGTSIDYITDRLDNRNTYIREEVKNFCHQAHTDLDARLKTLCGEFAAHKEQADRTARNNRRLKEKLLKQRLRNSELTKRLLEMEEMMNAQPEILDRLKALEATQLRTTSTSHTTSASGMKQHPAKSNSKATMVAQPQARNMNPVSSSPSSPRDIHPSPAGRQGASSRLIRFD
jgi:hypothetical protein